MARVPVCRVQQFSKGSLSAIGREVDRAEKNSRNEEIDATRSELNVTVKEAEGGTLYRAWNSWRKSHNCADQKISKTMTAFEGIVLTCSPEVFADLGWNTEDGCWDPVVRERCKEFIMKQYEFICEQIGEENILSATIHFDETTPHMQLYYVPAVDFVMQKQYAKDDQGKILRNENGSPVYARDDKGKIITERVDGTKINRGAFWGARGGKTSYNKLQTEHYQHMAAAYPELRLERGQEGSTAEHTTKYQWQKEQQEEVIDRLHDMAQEIADDYFITMGNVEDKQQELQTIEQAIAAKKEERDSVQAEIDSLTAVLSEKEVNSIAAKKTLFGKTEIDWKDWERVRNTARTAESAMAEAEAAKKAKEEAEKAKEAAEQAQSEAEAAYRTESERLRNIYQSQVNNIIADYKEEAGKNLAEYKEKIKANSKAELDKALAEAEAERKQYESWNRSLNKQGMQNTIDKYKAKSERLERFLSNYPDLYKQWQEKESERERSHPR